jgi:hypothetical protein
LFRGSKVTQKIIREISKSYKNSQIVEKIKKSLNYLKKSAYSWKSEEKWIIYRQLRDLTIIFLRKTKIFQKFIKPTKKFFWPKQKKTCVMILNDKPNCQVSRILMDLRPIYVKRSENDSITISNLSAIVVIFSSNRSGEECVCFLQNFWIFEF